eukprot:m.898710 g.898710  ORF g.898710 m.898710 type:complete len:70 (+) comp23675_c0_seq9:2937-3146(+)
MDPFLDCSAVKASFESPYRSARSAVDVPGSTGSVPTKCVIVHNKIDAVVCIVEAGVNRIKCSDSFRGVI